MISRTQLRTSFMVLATFLCLAARAEDVVRVRLAAQQSDVVLTGQALRVQGISSVYRSVAIPQKENLRIRRFVKQGHSFWLLSYGKAARSQIISDRFLLIEGQNLQWQSRALPSKIFLSAANKNTMDLVGVVPLEEYVAGVVASEMPANWPEETLKAQAVAARSYVLAVQKERRRQVHHVESTVLDQVFQQLNEFSSEKFRKVQQAVRQTRGQKLLSFKGESLKTFYHADCGGKTTSPRAVWGGSGVSYGETHDSSCPATPNSSWQWSLDRAELFAKIKKHLRKKIGIQDIQFVTSPGEDRVQELRVVLIDQQERRIRANDLRGLLGFQNLKSTLFKVREEKGLFTFAGSGYGHGVGLCQWGSRHLGMQGKSYAQILKHYYPRAKLVNESAGIRN